MFLFHALAILFSCLIVAGCATIIRGTTQDVSVNTVPYRSQGAFSNGQSCTSPCTIEVKRDQSLQITIEKQACHTHTATMMANIGRWRRHIGRPDRLRDRSSLRPVTESNHCYPDCEDQRN